MNSHSVDLACRIKETVTMHMAVERYGLHPNRAGYVSCPFHDERTPSLKLYESGGFYCFGCHAGGSVIDFVMKLFNLDFRAATFRLAYDFGLPVDARMGRKEALEARARVTEREQKRQHLERARTACREAIDISRNMAPKTPDDPWDDRWVQAMKEIPKLEAELEELEVELRA